MTVRRWILKAAGVGIVCYAMVCMWHWKIGFTFFTQLSNLFAGLTLLLQLLRPGRRWAPLKFSAAVSITVTALVYALVLAPVMPGGLLAAYRQDHWASLCMHVLVPALTVTDFLLNDREYSWRRRHELIALIPPLAYLVFILILGQAGFTWHGMTAPYPFLNYGAPCGWFGWMPETASRDTLGIGVAYAMAAMLLLFLAIGWMLRRMAGGHRES